MCYNDLAKNRVGIDTWFPVTTWHGNQVDAPASHDTEAHMVFSLCCSQFYYLPLLTDRSFFVIIFPKLKYRSRSVYFSLLLVIYRFIDRHFFGFREVQFFMVILPVKWEALFSKVILPVKPFWLFAWKSQICPAPTSIFRLFITNFRLFWWSSGSRIIQLFWKYPIGSSGWCLHSVNRTGCWNRIFAHFYILFFLSFLPNQSIF